MSVPARRKLSVSSVGRVWRTSRLGTGAAIILTLLATLLAGVGWLYALRGLGWLSGGPKISDSLPLLQLSGRDAQPLERVVVAWLAAGLVAGVVLRRLPRSGRAAAAGVIGLVVLLLASQASFSATRNVSFGHALFSRTPGLGPWLEAGMFTVGCLLPGRASRPDLQGRVGSQPPPGSVSRSSPVRILERVGRPSRVRDLGLRPRKDRDTGQD